MPSVNPSVRLLVSTSMFVQSQKPPNKSQGQASLQAVLEHSLQSAEIVLEYSTWISLT